MKKTSSWLQDDAARIERILTVVEVNSVVEGLPPLDRQTRERLRQRLIALSAPAQGPHQ